MPMPEILEVTDGTDTVSFLNEGSGFVLDEWNPKIAQRKDGGVWKDSGIADGRIPAFIRYENVDEEFALKVTGENMNALYRNMRKLRNLLNKASTYYLTGFAYEPVWFKIKGKDEAYPRYSVIVGWHYDEENNPFHPPMSGPITNSTMDEFAIFIERRPFFNDTEPETDVAIESSVVQAYNGLNLGNVDSAGVRDPTTAAEVFFSNQHTFMNLTHVYEDDGGAFTDLLAAALPHRLLPAVPAVGDHLYFGCAVGSAAPGPFLNLIFDIGTAAVGVTGQWEFWNGGAWQTFAAFGDSDTTDDFSNTGVLGVFWDNVSTWVPNVINAVNAWWIRFNVTGIAAPTGGTQQNRDIYSCTWPYIEVQDDQVKGDIPALLRMKIRNESNYDDDIQYQKYTDHVLCGARGVDRGDDFTAYIPLSDIQLISGQSITVGGFVGYIADVQYSARGRCIENTLASPGFNSFTVTLDNTIANQYKGRFHMYLRKRIGGVAGDWTIQIQSRAYGNLWRSDIVGITSNTTSLSVLDMGVLNLPPAGFGNNETVEEIEFTITMTHVAGASNLRLYELILLPADEWMGSFYGNLTSHGDYGPNLTRINYLDANSVTFPKKMVYCPVRVRASGNMESQWTNANVGPLSIEGERKTRYWFLTQNPQPIVANLRYAQASYAHNIQLSVARRYFSAIGKSL